MEINPLKQLYDDFMNIVDNSVIKYKTEADNYETLTSKKNADAFIKASLEEDVFETYYRYDEGIISEVMNVTNSDEIAMYHNDRSLIPQKYRATILSKQRAKIKSEYIELNNYYRCLNGLPNIEDSTSDYFYITDPEYTQYNIPTDKAIHELDNNIIALLDLLGYIDKLIKANPKKKYLRYLGSNKIDILTSRRGRNFSLLKIPTDISESSRNSFSLIYEQCREYFMTCIYIPEYRKTIDYYDNFIALCIMVMTIQQITSRVLKSAVERDFYDDNSIRTLFSAYGIPYHNNMDADTRRGIVQNLNTLIQNKGTSKVIYDISSLLGYDRIQLYKYYLMKTQKFDVDGIPIKKYKTDPITGEEVLDYQSNFDLYFQKVLLDEQNFYQSLTDTNNRISYEDVTSNDPYWIEDNDLQKELYESEYNFVESKYMGVSISYRLTRILFDNIYLLKMIFENKDKIDTITLELPKISLYASVSLFDAICILCAMTCKQNNLRGEILTRPSAILHVMGFSFNRDYSLIREDILKDPYLDDELVDFFETTVTHTPATVNNLYSNYLHLYDTILSKMEETQDIEVYRAYKKFYRTIFYTDENQKMFNIGTESNPIYPETFLDYLKVSNPDMYDFIESVESDKMYVYTNHICNKIISIIPNIKCLGIFADTSSTVESMLLDLVRFFKSYTTDMISLNTLYVYDLKPELLIKLIDRIETLNKTITPTDDLAISYLDHLSYTTKSSYTDNSFLIDGKIRDISVLITLFDNNRYSDMLKAVHTKTLLKEDTPLWDFTDMIKTQMSIMSSNKFKDVVSMIFSLNEVTKFSFNDIISLIKDSIMNDNFTMMDTYDIIGTILLHSNFIKFREKLLLRVSDTYKEDFTIYDKVNTIISKVLTYTKMSMYDTSDIINTINCNEKQRFRDTYKITYI